MSLYDQLDDEDLIEQLDIVARYVENDAAHHNDPKDYRRLVRLADTCRQAAIRLEQLILMVKSQPSQPPDVER